MTASGPWTMTHIAVIRKIENFFKHNNSILVILKHTVHNDNNYNDYYCVRGHRTVPSIIWGILYFCEFLHNIN